MRTDGISARTDTHNYSYSTHKISGLRTPPSQFVGDTETEEIAEVDIQYMIAILLPLPKKCNQRTNR